MSQSQLDRIEQAVNNTLKGVNTTMAGITDIQAALAAEKADLATATGLLAQLISAFATGAITPVQAQSLLDTINAEDATVKTNIASIQAALPAPPPVGP